MRSNKFDGFHLVVAFMYLVVEPCPPLTSTKKRKCEWSNLPNDMLVTIAKKLRHVDILHFGSVCKPWRLVYLENSHYLPEDLPLQLCCPRLYRAPLLLHSCNQASDSRKYVCVVDENVQGEIFLPEAVNKWICGSSWGWLVTVNIRGQDVCLLNPFTKHRIDLPSMDRFPQVLNALGQPDDADRNTFHFLRKAILSKDPTSSPQDCIVMAIVGNIKRLCFCKLGDDKWTYIRSSPCATEAVSYYQGRFYAVTEWGLTISFDGRNPNDSIEVVARGPGLSPVIPKRYLVHSGGDLLQVERIHKSFYSADEYDSQGEEAKDGKFEDFDDQVILIKRQTVKFEVYKLVKRDSLVTFPSTILQDGFRGSEFEGSTEYHHSWFKLEELHDRLLFIGFNGSFSLPASVYPNCRGRRIYFCDDHQGYYIYRLLVVDHHVPGYQDIGVFDLEDKTCSRYYPNDRNDLMPAVWMVPNLW